jgi:chaperonin GroES
MDEVISNSNRMAKVNIRPLGENVLIASEKAVSKTTSGIYLPDTATGEKPQQGKVIAIGDSDKIKVKSGETVIYTRYGGTEVKVDGVEYLIVTQKDLLAVIK